MTFLSRLARFVGWLRADDQGGPPWHGGIPLLALRGRQLTDDDVTLIADELAFSIDPDSGREIRRAIKAVTRMSVGEPDVARVRARLAEAGWPRAAPGRERPLA
jgi:hypothetical protein